MIINDKRLTQHNHILHINRGIPFNAQLIFRFLLGRETHINDAKMLTLLMGLIFLTHSEKDQVSYLFSWKTDFSFVALVPLQ